METPFVMNGRDLARGYFIVNPETERRLEDRRKHNLTT
jgi:hypothetical protein